MAAPSKTVIEIEGRRLTLSNLDKVMYPATGFTKAAIVDYYARVAPVMLPHLHRRAVTMVRYPDGVDGNRFFEKRCPPHAPDWVEQGESSEGLVQCVLDDVAALVWVANLAALELHTLQATVDRPGVPTSLVLDLDPGPGTSVLDCGRVAVTLRDMLSDLGLATVVKTSGGKGLHLAMPVKGATAEQTKAFALALGELVARDDPKRVTTVMAKEMRKGRVFVDWSQNDRHKTTVCASSLRAQPAPTVSTPVSWDEVTDAMDAGDPRALTFEAPQVLERVDELGDLYEADLTEARPLPDAGRLAS